MVVLLTPQSTKLSGGYLYNRYVSVELPGERFRYLQLASRPAAAKPVHPKETEYSSGPEPPAPQELAGLGVPATATLLLDSLYLSYPRWVEALHAHHRGALAMLVHYLPSLDPILTQAAAEKLRRAEIACLSCCSRVIVPSHYMKKELERLLEPASPLITLAPPGVRITGINSHGKERVGLIDRPSSHTPSEPKLLTIANWTTAKNHRFLLLVLAELRDLPWRWRIFGGADEKGALTEEFRYEAKELGLSERIHIGPQIEPEQVQTEMRQADLFLFPSRFESYGMVVAEALAAGLPVVANRTGGIPEVGGDSPAVILCSGDEDFAARSEWRLAMSRLLRSEKLRNQLSIAAAKRAQSLPGWPDTAALILSALEQN